MLHFQRGFEVTEPEFAETSSPCQGQQVNPTGTVDGVGGIKRCCAIDAQMSLARAYKLPEGGPSPKTKQNAAP